MRYLVFLSSISAACSATIDWTDAGPDLGQTDLSTTRPDAADAALPPPDAAKPECQWGGAPGTCLDPSACSAIADHSPKNGTCAAALQCCIDTPDTSDNPPTPTGWKLMMQSQVTPAMTNWAVMILHDPMTYPMWATTTQTFNTLMVLARVEWHPPDFQNSIVHRGVTLYVPQ